MKGGNMKSTQMEKVKLADGTEVNRNRLCLKLRKQTVDGEEIECATDAFYKRDKSGALILLYNNKSGKAEKKRLKRERVKERNSMIKEVE